MSLHQTQTEEKCMKMASLMKIALVLGLFGVTAGLSRAQTVFIDTNSVWKYLGDGSDQGTAWVAPTGFDDSTWPMGPGRLGFGGDGEQTVIGVQANGYITFYFRHAFNVTGAAGVMNLLARYQRDDGVIVYLNGTPVITNNMPAGPITFQTQANAPAVAGAGETQFFTNLISPALLMEGPNVIAAEVHQRHGDTTFSSDLGWYLELRGDVPAGPPSVALVNPVNTAMLAVNNVTVNATANDVDGTVNQVQFFQGTTSLGVDTTAPYGIIWPNVSPGTYTLTAAATDSQGLSATSTPVVIRVVAPLASLVPLGATWKYLDNGTDQGTAWTAPTGFDDSSWASGPAELGYGDDDEATVVGFGGDPANKFITTYFRHAFSISNPGSISTLTLRVVRDDGVVVYLNGVEILRNNMTNEVINYLTPALEAIEDEPIVVTNINVADLPAGTLMANNVLAVEIHQSGGTSSDISFDLQLIANAGANPPVVILTAPTNNAQFATPATVNLSASATDLDGAIAMIEFTVDGVLVGTPDMTVAYGRTATDISPCTHILRAVATDNSGLTSTAQVSIFVAPGGAIFTLVNSNSTWKYLDDGSDQGVAWRAFGFGDSGWGSGPAELGFGDPGENVTMLSQTSPAGTTNITFYFRKQFTATGVASLTNLAVRLKRDDGGVVYINNMEVFRSNMTNDPAVPILYTDFAGNATGTESAFNSTNISPSVLVEGPNNIVAVEVHQQNLTSSDVRFDLQLQGQAPGGPFLILQHSGATVTLSWCPNTAGFRLEQAPGVTGPWTTRSSQSNPQSFTPSGQALFFRLVNP